MSQYQELCDAYRVFLAEDPNACVQLGLDEKLDQLPDPSLAKIHATREQAAGLRRRAESLLPELEDFHQRLDTELIALAARQVEVDNGLRCGDKWRAERQPRAGEEVSTGIFLMVTNDPRSAAERLDDIRGRLDRVPAYLDSALGRLDTPVSRWVDIDLETIGGLPDFFASIETWAGEEGYAGLRDLRASVARANAAFAAYGDSLRSLPTTDEFSLGKEQTLAVLEAGGLELSPDQIHDVARGFVQRTRSEIESLRSTLTAKYGLAPETSASELQQFLASRFALRVEGDDFSSVIDYYQGTARRLDQFVSERQLFPVPSSQAMRIMQTPDFMAPLIPAGAMMSPAPLREGTRTSQVYLTLGADLMDEHTELSVPIMMVHEGIPGHHLQLATASMHESLVRRTFVANEHAEGWTTMLEDYMLDQGLMGDLTDEARFITKLDISRIGARVGIDLYFMTGEKRYLDIGYDLALDHEDPFANAAELLVAATGFTPARAQAELNWYSLECGYPLSYLVGNHLVWTLKRDYEEAVTGAMPREDIDRSFHRIYLESGNMPVACLRRVFEHELQQSLG